MHTILAGMTALVHRGEAGATCQAVLLGMPRLAPSGQRANVGRGRAAGEASHAGIVLHCDPAMDPRLCAAECAH